MNWRDINEQQKENAGFNFDYGPLLDELIAKLPSNPIVVELGTYLGCSTAYFAEKLPEPSRLFTVDLFQSYGKSSNFLPQAVLNLKACGARDKVHFLTCRSWEAAQFFDNGECDLVWLDAGHDFVSVKADLDAWWEKVKPGGILAGHDYSESGVALAVDRFCFSAQKKVNVYQPEGWKSWWLQM